MELTTGENDASRRLDRLLRKALPDYPLALLHKILRQGLVLVDGKKAKAQDRVGAGSLIKVPPLTSPPASRGGVCALVFDLGCGRADFPMPWGEGPEILWQGDGLLAVNKPSGLAVHSGQGDFSPIPPKDLYTLEDAVRFYLKGRLPPSLSFRPGPLHRLDKPSSGIVVFSASLKGARFFSEALRRHLVRKIYLALLSGRFEKEAVWQDGLFRDKKKRKTFVANVQDGSKTAEPKTAHTKVFPIAAGEKMSLVKIEISTGRTHQIRAQAASHGYPLAGDYKYGAAQFLERTRLKAGFFLHAWKMDFKDASLRDISIEAPLPSAFADLLQAEFKLNAAKLPP